MNLKLAPVTKEIVDSLREKCSALYPRAVVFFTEADRANHLTAVLASPLSATADGSVKEGKTDEVDAVAEKLESLSCSDGNTTSTADTSANPNGRVPTNKMNGHVGPETSKKLTKQQKRQKKPAVVAAAKV